MSNLTSVLTNSSSEVSAVEVVTKQCLAIRLRLYEHAIRLVEDGFHVAPGLDGYMLAASGRRLVRNLFSLSKQIRNCCEEAGMKGGAWERDLDRAELLGDRLLYVLGTAE